MPDVFIYLVKYVIFGSLALADLQELNSLKEDIDRGLTDLAAGRVQDFDMKRVIERGRKLLAGRSRSA
jgi:hypothetical protein